MIFCIDTSAMIDAGLRRYPADLFPAFWDRMDALADAGRLKAPPTLIEELERQDEEWKTWVYERSEQIIVPPDANFIESVRTVVDAYVRLGADPEKLTGDPFFVALSMAKGMTLLTSEQPGKGKVKLPTVCQATGVKHCNLLDFMRQENWRF